jgi:diketogulonate reductase-like aldo/keto reductase
LEKNIDTRVKLNNGIEMPYLGLGVYLADVGSEVQQAMNYALKVGYRLFDTASFYGNEADVGRVVRESSVPRQEIFVTTKLWNSDQGYDRSLKAFQESLDRMGLETIDLFLIHWPVEELRKESWRALETLYEEGKCRAIGVSNYTISHLEELLSDAKIVPMVNQVEFSPFLYQKHLLKFCRKNGIQLESYSPLTRGKKFKHPVLKKIAAKYRKSAAQILLRWVLEHDVVVIPKSSNPDRILENAEIFNFKIDDEDMMQLNGLDENYRVSWNPNSVP